MSSSSAPHSSKGSQSGDPLDNLSKNKKAESPSIPADPELKSEPKIGTSRWRPANILFWSVSNSKRLIGWNDDEFRELIEEHRRRRKDDPTLPNAEVNGFGLMNILINTVKEAVYKKTDFHDLKSDLKKLEGKEDIAGTPGARELAIDATVDIIGTNVNVREMKVYKNLLTSLKYQRDAYIMGGEHAELRKTQRAQEEEEEELKSMQDIADEEDEEEFIKPAPTYRDYLNKNPVVQSESLGRNQFTHLCSWFVPSVTVHNAVLPTFLWTLAPPPHLVSGHVNVQEGGPLRRVIHRSFCALIPLSQNLLDRTMKNSILYILSDQAWRDTVKGTSRNFLGGSTGVLGAQQNPVENKFVTTKTVRIH